MMLPKFNGHRPGDCPLTPDFPLTNNDRLNLLLDLKRYADAEESARETIARDPQRASGYTHRDPFETMRQKDLDAVYADCGHANKIRGKDKLLKALVQYIMGPQGAAQWKDA